MKRRIPKTPASPIGDQLRRESEAFRRDGQEGRAEGYLDAANRIDAWLFARKGPLERHLEDKAPSASDADLTARIEALEESVGNLAMLVASAAKGERVSLPVAKGPSFAFESTKPNGHPTLAKAKALPAILTDPPSDPEIPHGSLPKGEARILAAIVKKKSATSDDLTAMLGYRETSLRTYLGELRAKGMVQSERGTHSATDRGENEALPDLVGRLPLGSKLLAYWLDGRLPEGERRILAYVSSSRNGNPELHEIEGETGYRETSVRTYVGELIRKCLLTRPKRGRVALAPILTGEVSGG